MATVDRTGSDRSEVRSRWWPNWLRRAVVGAVVVLALVTTWVTYSYEVTERVEISTPHGVHLILARKAPEGPPPLAAGQVLDVLTQLAEDYPDDFGSPGYDRQHRRVVVNIASDRGESVYARLDLPDDVAIRVRHGAHSSTELWAVHELMHEVDEFYQGSTDAVNDRVVMTTNTISPGLLDRVKELAGTEIVAVRWDPFGEPASLA